jgi:hypothetical protein
VEKARAGTEVPVPHGHEHGDARRRVVLDEGAPSHPVGAVGESVVDDEASQPWRPQFGEICRGEPPQ